MSVVQKLCDEIVEPALKRSTAELTLDANTSTHHKSERSITNSISKKNGKVTKSITIEKRRVINKLDPQDIDSKSRTIVNQYKSKDLVRKKVADIAVNTFITGPLRCDHNCVTLVRKRDKDNHGCCKCSNRHTSKINAKQVQTFVVKDYSFADKACAAHCVETTSFGTQFMAPSVMMTPSSNRIRENLSNGTRKIHSGFIEFHVPVPVSIPIENKSSLGYMGARRWALTKYPTRGPDF